MVVIAIMVLLMVVIGAAWRSITDTNITAKAVNTISSYAAVARTYAMRHQLETVLTVDPRTGQLDMFVWDTQGVRNADDSSIYDVRPNSRYVYVPVLDNAARLPNRGDPTRPDNLDVRIAPIDYAEYDWRIREALARFAICFDPQGRVVSRDLTFVYQEVAPGQFLNPPMGVPVRALLPRWQFADLLACGAWTLTQEPSTDDEWWFQTATSRGGLSYVLANRADDPNDPNAVDSGLELTPFMLNQYTGRVMLQGVSG